MDYRSELEKRVRDMFTMDSTGHDMDHLKRVEKIALHLQKAEGGDADIISTAALLHDVHRLMEKEHGSYCPPIKSLPTIRKILEDIHFDPEKTKHVLHCIELHEEYGFSKAGKSATDIETLILQDADNLDAIGAIGIARTFSFGGAYGIPFWKPELPFDRTHYDEDTRDPSILHHIHAKLLKLKDNMNTATAKNMAEERHQFMVSFSDRLMKEWDGVL